MKEKLPGQPQSPEKAKAIQTRSGKETEEPEHAAGGREPKPRDTSNPHDVINYSSSKGDHHWSSSSFCDSGFARAYTSFMRPKIVYLTNSVSHVDYIVTRSLKLQ